MGSNLFYELSAKILPGSVEAPLDVATTDGIGRITVFGPTAHPLEVATMLGMMVPFALVGILDARRAAREAPLRRGAGGAGRRLARDTAQDGRGRPDGRRARDPGVPAARAS